MDLSRVDKKSLEAALKRLTTCNTFFEEADAKLIEPVLILAAKSCDGVDSYVRSLGYVDITTTSAQMVKRDYIAGALGAQLRIAYLEAKSGEMKERITEAEAVRNAALAEIKRMDGWAACSHCSAIWTGRPAAMDTMLIAREIEIP